MNHRCCRLAILFYVVALPGALFGQAGNFSAHSSAAAVASTTEVSDLPSAPVPRESQGQTTPTTQKNAQQNQSAQPSLQDLGISQNQVKGNAKEQAMLDKRTHMLKVHQTLGLITAIPMAVALITGPQAKAKGRNGEIIKEPTQTNLDLHAALGSLTTGLYFTTAYYEMFAPKLPGVKKKGAIRVHEALAFVHGPGMVLTPILGIMAFRQESNGEKVHGLASAHGAVAAITAASYGASIVAVSWPIHWKFWEKRP